MSEINSVPNVLLHLARSEAGTTRTGPVGASLVADQLPGGIQVGDRVTAMVLQSSDKTLLLSVRGQSVTIQAPGWQFPVDAELQLQVTALQPQPVLLVEAVSPSGRILPSLQPGQIVTAMVRENLPSGQMALTLDGIEIQADAPAGLRPGTQLVLQVEQTSPQIILRIVEQNPTILQEAVNLLRTHLGQQVTIGEVIASLQNALARVSGTPRHPAQSAARQPASALASTTVVSGSSPPPEQSSDLVPELRRGKVPGPSADLPRLGPSSAPAAVMPRPAGTVTSNPPAGSRLASMDSVPAAPAPLPGMPSSTVPASNVPQILPSSSGPRPATVPVASLPTAFSDSKPAAAGVATATPRTIASVVDGLLSAAPLAPPASSLIRLQTVLQALIPENRPPAPQQLTAFLENGGLHFEAKLAEAILRGIPPEGVARLIDSDIKGLLGRVQAEIQALPSEQMQLLMESVRRHLDHIETQQAINLLAQAQQEPFQLQVPLFIGNQLATVGLLIQPDGGRFGPDNDHPPGGFKVLFMLDLDVLGPVRIDAHFTERSLRAIFYLKNPTTVDRVRSELGPFRETLLGLGYDQVLLDARLLDQMGRRQQQELAALAAGMPQSIHLVDVRV